MANQVWVSGPLTGLALEINVFDGFPHRFTPKVAWITLTLSADRQSATDGRIAGVFDREELVEEFQRFVGALSPEFCNPSAPTVQSILNQVRESADIMSDGSQSSAECNGISFGFGFEAEAATVAGIGDPVQILDPCE